VDFPGQAVQCHQCEREYQQRCGGCQDAQAM
jgi:hypothetical protein